MKRSLLIALFSTLLFAGSSQAASDFLLELDGIKGESADDKHPGTIELVSFNWGVSNDGSTATGGGTGKVSFSDLHFSASMSKASPLLISACAGGMHIKEAKIYGRKAGDDKRQDYMRITLTDLLVTSYQHASPSPSTSPTGTAAPVAQEQIVIKFNSALFEHIAEDGTVTSGRAVRTE